MRTVRILFCAALLAAVSSVVTACGGTPTAPDRATPAALRGARLQPVDTGAVFFDTNSTTGSGDAAPADTSCNSTSGETCRGGGFMGGGN